MSDQNNIKVMIVDDSLSMRLFLSKILNSAKGIKVVCTASDPIDAMEKLKHTEVDVMTLDVEMPKMDGITFLKKIMRLKPMPVVMISTLTKHGSQTAIEALDSGAVEVVGKPSHRIDEVEACSAEIITKVTQASCAKIGRNSNRHTGDAPLPSGFLSLTKEVKIDEVMPLDKLKSKQVDKKIIAIAASTGGPVVLKQIVSALDDENTPPIVIVQHIGVGFSEALAESMNKLSVLQVVHAQDGQLLKSGHVYIAPAGMHMGVVNDKGHFKTKFYDYPKVNRHKPSADVLFRTVNAVAGKKALAVVLTGMGNDGAFTLKEICQAGGQTYVQQQESCTVYGMPRMALELESKHKAVHVPEMIKKIKEYTS
ncbi:MAG: chemotaxis response regulator protein-glutamate methylesterase [Magnetococcales bacterium]|nr:chemotaxis response regulator protein-glutamate methylesterase [Magnetococcales bacterium]|tara:strand:- start:10729 stop:11829 length:1101 start_codon:yes stop_codon:yes gene_type:complete